MIIKISSLKPFEDYAWLYDTITEQLKYCRRELTDKYDEVANIRSGLIHFSSDLVLYWKDWKDWKVLIWLDNKLYKCHWGYLLDVLLDTNRVVFIIQGDSRKEVHVHLKSLDISNYDFEEVIICTKKSFLRRVLLC